MKKVSVVLWTLKTLIMLVAIFYPVCSPWAEIHPNGWICPAGFCTCNTEKGAWHGYLGHVGVDYVMNVHDAIHPVHPIYAVSHGIIEDFGNKLSDFGSQCGAPGGAVAVRYTAKGRDGYSRRFYSVYGHIYKKGLLQKGDMYNGPRNIDTKYAKMRGKN